MKNDLERIKTYERSHRPPSRKKRQRKKMVEERERERTREKDMLMMERKNEGKLRKHIELK